MKQFLIYFIFTFFGLLINASPSSQKSVQIKKINNWNIQVQSNELALTTAVSDKVLLMLYGPHNVLFVSSDYSPVSPQSIKKILKEWGGKNLKTHRSKKGTVFSFQINNSIHWLSTTGGYLVAETDHLTTKKYQLLRKASSEDIPLNRLIFMIFLFFVFGERMAIAESSSNDPLYKQYGGSSCGLVETDRVIESIADFRTMINQMEKNDKCDTIKENLNNHIPKTQDIIDSISSARESNAIQDQIDKQDIGEILLTIRKIKDDQTNSSSEKKNEKVKQLLIQQKSLEDDIFHRQKRQLYIQKTKADIKGFTPIVNNMMSYASQMQQAFNNACFQKDSAVSTQALFSLVNISSLLFSASPAGAGIALAAKFTRTLLTGNNKYSTKNLDDIQMVTGLQCALDNIHNQHCEIMKKYKLQEQTKTESGSLCIDCAEKEAVDFLQDIKDINQFIGNLEEIKKRKDNISPHKSFSDYLPQIIDPLSRYNKFYLHILSDEDFYTYLHNNLSADIDNENDSILNPYDQRMLSKGIKRYKKLKKDEFTSEDWQEIDRKKESINMLAENAGKAYYSNNTGQPDRLSGYRPWGIQNLKNLNIGNHLIVAKKYSKFQAEKIEDYRKKYPQYAPNDDVQNMLTYINLSSVYDVLELRGTAQKITGKIDDIRKARTASAELTESFSKIFTPHALEALKYYKDNPDKTDPEDMAAMCFSLIGLKGISKNKNKHKHKKINSQCNDSKINFTVGSGEKILKYSDYQCLPHSDRVCIVQDFYKCMDNDENSPSCISLEKKCS